MLSVAREARIAEAATGCARGSLTYLRGRCHAWTSRPLALLEAHPLVVLFTLASFAVLSRAAAKNRSGERLPERRNWPWMAFTA